MYLELVRRRRADFAAGALKASHYEQKHTERLNDIRRNMKQETLLFEQHTLTCLLLNEHTLSIRESTEHIVVSIEPDTKTLSDRWAWP